MAPDLGLFDLVLSIPFSRKTGGNPGYLIKSQRCLIMLYYNQSEVGSPSYEYVAWVDIMGTLSSMSRSVETTANFIGKLYVAALKSERDSVRLYPVMDGLYAVSENQRSILYFLRQFFTMIAQEFNSSENRYRFMIRGGISFGPVYHGDMITESASRDLARESGHRDSLLFGMPMIQAYSAEGDAPPYGISVHESARAFCPSGDNVIPHRWFMWRHSHNNETWKALKHELNKYLDWCSCRSRQIGYPKEKIEFHKEIANEYFSD